MPSNLPTELHLDTFIGDRGAAWLREHAQEPFFAWVSFNSPHDPYDPPAELADLYQDAPIPEPAGSLADLDWAGRSADCLSELPPEPVVPDGLQPPDAGATRRIRAHYYAEVTHVDRQVGKLIAALEDVGVLDDTLIIYTSDHGDALGDHGLIFKSFFYESMVRVPFIARGPGVVQGGRSDALIETTDVVATILTHLGRPLPSPCQSRPLQPLLADPSLEHRDAVFSYVEDRAMVRTGRWKLGLYGDGDGELYELDDDPSELRNLFHEPAQAAVRTELLRPVRP